MFHFFRGWTRANSKVHPPAQKHRLNQPYDRWKEAFAAIPLKETTEPKEFPHSKFRSFYKYFKELVALEDEETIRARWSRRSARYREVAWPRLMYAALRFFPESACILLRATWEESRNAPYIVTDAIWYLVRRRSTMSSRNGAQNLCETINFLLAKRPSSVFRLRQWDICRLVTRVESEDIIDKLYHELVMYGHPLHQNTLLQFGRRFAGEAAFKSTALEILEGLVKSGRLDANSPHIGALCTSILSPQATEDSMGQLSLSTAELFERILQLGFSPNLITYSVFIGDLCRKGQMTEALEVLRIMHDQGIEPDEILYSYLLHGAKVSGSWLPAHMLVQRAWLQNVRDPVVWNEVLHLVFMAYVSEERSRPGPQVTAMPTFRPMVKVYANIFKADVLRKLIPADFDEIIATDLDVTNTWNCEKEVLQLVYRTPSWETRGLIDPDHVTLEIMILGYIKSLGSPYSILSFYSHFQSLLQRGDPDIIRLVEKTGTRIYDHVLKALLQFGSTVNICLDIVSGMLEGSGPALTATASQRTLAQSNPPSKNTATSNDNTSSPKPKAAFCPPSPSVYTWSILINGLMYQREAVKAEQVIELMAEYGIDPSVVTWNTLAAGYANAQNARKTARTLLRLEAAGLKSDDHTIRAWNYLADKEKALEVMEGTGAQQKFSSKLAAEQSDLDMQNVAAGVDVGTHAADNDQTRVPKA